MASNSDARRWNEGFYAPSYNTYDHNRMQNHGLQDSEQYYASSDLTIPTSPSPAQYSSQRFSGRPMANREFDDYEYHADDRVVQYEDPSIYDQQLLPAEQDDYDAYYPPEEDIGPDGYYLDPQSGPPVPAYHQSYRSFGENVPPTQGAYMQHGAAHLAASAAVQPAPPRNKHGIALKPVSSLPDIYRSLFKFGVFNAMQSKCYETAVNTEENMIISSPTGSGKTVLFELALIRLLMKRDGRAKCVYMAPTKALCTERMKDWTAKFQAIGVNCCELTGDTVDTGRNAWSEAKKCTIIITTPEKWDSLTRTWSEHNDILSQMQLFLVDEVHILNESRGSTLEVCVSRMRLRGSGVRFVLLSATVPNIDDVAAWIGNSNVSDESASATVLKFGEEFRPCPITRIVYGYPRKSNANDFQFIKTLDYKLFGVLKEHSVNKPVMIFCATRKGVISTAELIAKEYKQVLEEKGHLPWPVPRKFDAAFKDKALQELSQYGVGVHHAGLDLFDRRTTEDLFTRGILRTVVATSTLAVGVNFPAHTVIIKGTKQWANNAWVEYSDLDIMQMIGRAGRPQFDKDGVAIILTEHAQEAKYKALVSGRTILESCLHSNLTEHINSEIQLGTITDAETAKDWLRSSFLFQRIQKNPKHYGMGKAEGQTWDGRLAELVDGSLKSLMESELIAAGVDGENMVATEYGEVMSRYYIRYATMCLILKLSEKASLRDILELISNADEFHDLRLRHGEKSVYNKMKEDDEIRFRIPKVDKVSDKIFTLVQAVLGGISLSSQEYKTPDSQPHLEAFSIFKHAARLAKAVVDVGVIKGNAHHIRYGMELVRSLNARAWEDRPVVLRQVDQIGEKSIKTLVLSGITNLAILREQQSSRIELLLNRNPPFGREIISAVLAMPQYTLCLAETAVSSSSGLKPVSATLAVEVGVLNAATTVKTKKGKSLSLGMTSILTVTSDLDLLDFRRISTKSLVQGKKSFEIDVTLTKPSQSVTVTVSADNFAGLSVHKTYKPALPPTEYPTLNTRPPATPTGIEKELEGIDTAAFWEQFDGDDDYMDLTVVDDNPRVARAQSGSSSRPIHTSAPLGNDKNAATMSSSKLANGNYMCNHNCKDKTQCRHLCCREGLPKAPKKSLHHSTDRNSPVNEVHSQRSKAAVDSGSRGIQMIRPQDSAKSRRTKPDKRLTELQQYHSAANVKSHLGIPSDGKLKFISSGKPADDPESRGPTFAELDLDEDDEELPEAADALRLIAEEVSKDKSKGRALDTSYGDDDMDAIIASLPEETVGRKSETLRSAPDRIGSSMIATSTPPPREMSSIPSLSRKAGPPYSSLSSHPPSQKQSRPRTASSSPEPPPSKRQKQQAAVGSSGRRTGTSTNADTPTDNTRATGLSRFRNTLQKPTIFSEFERSSLPITRNSTAVAPGELGSSDEMRRPVPTVKEPLFLPDSDEAGFSDSGAFEMLETRPWLKLSQEGIDMEGILDEAFDVAPPAVTETPDTDIGDQAEGNEPTCTDTMDRTFIDGANDLKGWGTQGIGPTLAAETLDASSGTVVEAPAAAEKPKDSWGDAMAEFDEWLNSGAVIIED